VAQTHIHRTETAGNDAHKNALATWTEVKSLHKQQTSNIQTNNQTRLDLRNTTPEYCFHIQNIHPGTFPFESFTHDSGRILVRAEFGYPKGSLNTNSQRSPRYISQRNARRIVHPNDPVSSPMAHFDSNRRLRRRLPNDMAARFIV
jgi:hypothetical protein